MSANKLLILVTGANEQLENCLRELTPTVPHKFIFTDVVQLDITNVEAVRTLMEKERPDFVINCAAYTVVDKAESEKEVANLLNAMAVQILADEAQKVGVGIVHISTDYVFKGNDPQPYKEDDVTEPISVYEITKLSGEKFASKNPKHILFAQAGYIQYVVQLC